MILFKNIAKKSNRASLASYNAPVSNKNTLGLLKWDYDFDKCNLLFDNINCKEFNWISDKKFAVMDEYFKVFVF